MEQPLNQKATATLGALCIGALCFIAAFILWKSIGSENPLSGRTVVPLVASSTTYTLTTTSQLLAATSSSRVALSVQPTNCTISGMSVYLANSSLASAANPMAVVQASSTWSADDSTAPRNVENALNGITQQGTCSVVVTEWRER